jgi:GT2 family glycosyltransferase
VISNFNGAKYLPRVLETLRGQRGVDVQVVVVDRNSTDESAEILAANPDVTVVKEPPESGLVTGYDVGSAHAARDLLFFCNEDMWFDPDCLRRLADHIDLPNRVFAADPWQWTYDGLTWIHGGTRFRPARLDLNTPFPARAYDFTCPLPDGAVVPFGCAGAVLVHRAVYRELGGWDRGFFLDHEDVDLFLRAWQAGWKCVTVPGAKVYHAVNVSNTKAISGGRQRVGRRRYISGRSSLPVLGVKYFTGVYEVLPLFVWLGLTARHLLTLRLTRLWWQLVAGREFLARLPAALEYRRRHARTIRARPGQAFFRAAEFQAGR